MKPKLLLLDEPFGALDAKVRKSLRVWLRALHDPMGLTSIFVTHDQAEAMEMADRVAVCAQAGSSRFIRRRGFTLNLRVPLCMSSLVNQYAQLHCRRRPCPY